MQATRYRLHSRPEDASFSPWHTENKYHALSVQAHQDAEGADIYLYTSKDKAEKTQEPKALQWA